jgi:hypothetical protein
MKDPSSAIRDWVYDTLNGAVSYGGSAVTVYSFPSKDATMPYILIGENYMLGERGTKDAYISEHDIMIEVYTSYTGNRASYASVDSIADDIIQLLRTRIMPAITGYNCISVLVDNMVTDRFTTDTNIIIYKLIQIKLMLEES